MCIGIKNTTPLKLGYTSIEDVDTFKKQTVIQSHETYLEESKVGSDTFLEALKLRSLERIYTIIHRGSDDQDDTQTPGYVA